MNIYELHVISNYIVFDQQLQNNLNCIRSATIYEIETYKNKCKQLNIKPNHKLGGFRQINNMNEWSESQPYDIYFVL